MGDAAAGAPAAAAAACKGRVRLRGPCPTPTLCLSSFSHLVRCLPPLCASRQLNRDLFYTVVRAVIVIAAALVFATLFQGQGKGVSTFTQVLNVAGSM